MSISVQSGRPLVVFLLLNSVFWIWFWVDVSTHLSPFEDRPPEFEEIIPVYRFWGVALPPNADVHLVVFRTLHVVQAPTLFLVARSITLFSNRGWDERCGALSIGAWVLILTTLGSYLQWSLIGLLMIRLGPVIRRKASNIHTRQ